MEGILNGTNGGHDAEGSPGADGSRHDRDDDAIRAPVAACPARCRETARPRRPSRSPSPQVGRWPARWHPRATQAQTAPHAHAVALVSQQRRVPYPEPCRVEILCPPCAPTLHRRTEPDGTARDRTGATCPNDFVGLVGKSASSLVSVRTLHMGSTPGASTLNDIEHGRARWRPWSAHFEPLAVRIGGRW